MHYIDFTGKGNDFPAPPEGFEFRLLGWRSKKVIFSRNAAPGVGISDPQPVNPDQIFTLIHGTGDKKGLYAIKSVNTGKVLFSRQGQVPVVGHVDGDGDYDDNWFRFELGTMDSEFAGENFDQYFRLVTPSADRALVSRTHAEPWYFNHPASDPRPDHYFTFIPAGKDSVPPFGGKDSFPPFGGKDSFPPFGGKDTFPPFGF